MTNDYNMTEETVQTTVFENIVGIFVSPIKVFKGLANKPRVLSPMIIMPFVVLLFYLLFFSSFKEMMVTQLETVYETQLADADIEMTDEFVQFQTRLSVILGMVFAPFAPVAAMLFGAIYYFVAAKIAGGETFTFKKSLAVTSHVGLISILSYVVLGAVSFMKGTFALQEPVTSIASFLPASMNQGLLYGLLINVEVFTLWSYILTAQGLIYTGGLSKKKAYIITGIAFTAISLYTGFSLWFSSVMMSRMGGF